MKQDDTLNITQYIEQPQDKLKLAIAKGVEDRSTSVLVGTLPHQIVMRQDQYDLLVEDPDLKGMYGTDDRIYMTPLNVMEVKVLGKHVSPAEMLGLKGE